jgi:DHA2 family multidrug resistance protein
MALLMPISGTLADRIGARPFVLVGMVIAAAGTFLFARIDLDWSIGHIAFYNLIRTGALGLLFTPLTTAALANVPRMRAGAASAILNTIWQVGGSLGIAIGQTYVTSRVAVRYAETIAGFSLAHPQVQAAIEQAKALLTQHNLSATGAVPMIAGLYQQAATVQAYGDTFLLGAIIVSASIPLAFFLSPHRRS